MLQIELSTLQKVTKGLTEITDKFREYVPPHGVTSDDIRWSLILEGEAQLIL